MSLCRIGKLFSWMTLRQSCAALLNYRAIWQNLSLAPPHSQNHQLRSDVPAGLWKIPASRTYQIRTGSETFGGTVRTHPASLWEDLRQERSSPSLEREGQRHLLLWALMIIHHILKYFVISLFLLQKQKIKSFAETLLKFVDDIGSVVHGTTQL